MTVGRAPRSATPVQLFRIQINVWAAVVFTEAQLLIAAILFVPFNEPVTQLIKILVAIEQSMALG